MAQGPAQIHRLAAGGMVVVNNNKDLILELQIDHLVGKLHGGDNVEHVGSLAHLFLIKDIKMGQAGAADKNMNPLLFKFLDLVKNR